VLAALNVALVKARSIDPAHQVIVAADTVVALDGQSLGKPSDAAAAHDMLRQLRGRPHDVLTGVVLRTSGAREWAAVISTQVVMRSYSDAEIDSYIQRDEPFDKAGAYAIQDADFAPVERLEGCYLNVVGLPLCAVASGLAAFGVEVPNAITDARPPCELCRRGAPLVAIERSSRGE
jgi:septum formation protein